jgi:hypothetical protein
MSNTRASHTSTREHNVNLLYLYMTLDQLNPMVKVGFFLLCITFQFSMLVIAFLAANEHIMHGLYTLLYLSATFAFNFKPKGLKILLWQFEQSSCVCKNGVTIWNYFANF